MTPINWQAKVKLYASFPVNPAATIPNIAARTDNTNPIKAL